MNWGICRGIFTFCKNYGYKCLADVFHICLIHGTVTLFFSGLCLFATFQLGVLPGPLVYNSGGLQGQGYQEASSWHGWVESWPPKSSTGPKGRHGYLWRRHWGDYRPHWLLMQLLTLQLQLQHRGSWDPHTILNYFWTCCRWSFLLFMNYDQNNNLVLLSFIK